MNQVEIGKFIAQNRKEKNLTQAQLAEKLNITDRAVSKWETGKNMPDASLILELCEILNIRADKLLSGKKTDAGSFDKKTDETPIVLKRKKKNRTTKNAIIAIVFSAFLLAGIIACTVCDAAITGNLTWSLIPVSSIVFAWLVSFPIIILGRKGAFVSLTLLSVFVIPYLYTLSALLKVKAVFTIGTVMAIISIVYLWINLAIFHRLRRKRIATGIMFLLTIPFMLIINITLSKMISEPILDIWDVLVAFVLLIAASVSFVCDFTKGKEWIK